ncbi:MFS general substrate transporter [Tothia fuscella]|uniref:MFS general substrate transporter n=1 Tax=Tothia fuscella TaxID=1048955 RepID=A0A9P4U2V8_9PEZI|nr:MFS general substrate transporter [Tothia fuscella]
MWSYIQYHRIGRDLDTSRRKREAAGESCEHLQVHDEPQHGSRTNGQLFSYPLPLSFNVKTQPKHPGESDQNSENENGERLRHGKILVEIDGTEDPFDPHNWPMASRCKSIAILALTVFVQGWAGSAESMANSAISQDLHVSQVAENLATAMYLFGIGTGSLFAGPISETYGRNPIYLATTFCYMLFVLGSALTPTFGGQVVCRYFVGLFADGTLAINGSSVGDQFRPVKRSMVFPVIAWANVAAPVIAPIAGGWIVSNPKLGWRWTEWTTLIMSAFALLVALLFLPETYLPVLLDWKAQQLRRATGNKNYTSEHAETASFRKRMKQVLPMPIKFFSSEPVIIVLGGYLVLLYILLFTFQSGFDYVFKQTYSLSTRLTGSCFGAIAAGSTAFTLTAPFFYRLARWETEHVRGAPIKPEFRLWPAILAAPLLPVSLFWLGWTNYSSISIWSGLGACFLFGIIVTVIYVSSYEYIIDGYADHSAAALSSITMARYIIAGGMVMAARPMYMGIGVHWTMTLLGCVALILAPAPWLFLKYESRLREKSRYAVGDEYFDNGEES